ncbi:SRPBCC family protein [Streptomyces oceani]|uniref:Polyketide cyclase n=1 Tax=Streptomyces oceani TaxID=1075402 RepID=A0A1E7JZ35_9ACTN|nr:SRPBCC family protein [Streptomyces oceani]OEU96934.1 hypothetical protein AN216_18495 [Streptomyces oceani]
MTVRQQISVQAPPAAVWAVLVDIESWPEYVSTVTSVRKDTRGALAAGSRVRVKQPGMPELTWTVTEFTEGRSFTWIASAAGVTTIGGHRLREATEGGCELELTIEHRGFLAPLLRVLTYRRTRRYVGNEANGMRLRAEARARE